MTPERPEDLGIIVEDFRAFMSSNLPQAVAEQFPRSVEQVCREEVVGEGVVETKRKGRAGACDSRLLQDRSLVLWR